jgi:UDP:flavonoid glycosyltransferase YjiC (YdhE family)
VRVLFLPNYLGGGFGHIGRCVALAQEFSLRGDDVVFMMNGPHVKSVTSDHFKVRLVDYPPMPFSGGGNAPAYMFVSDMSYQVVRDGFSDRNIVDKSITACLNIVKEIKPDLLVGDGHCLTGILGKISGTPVVQFIKSVVNPFPEKMVWWEAVPDLFIPPDPLPVFNPVLKKYGLKEISRAEELLFGDLYILPSIPLLDPMKKIPENYHYVGPIIRKTGENEVEMPKWFEELDREKSVVYITVGGAAGHGGNREFFKIVSEGFEKSDLQVVVSTGKKVEYLKEYSNNRVKFVSWVPGVQMIAASNVVVFHGGYTRMEILKQGIPSVVIPFHSEQEFYGRLLEDAGVSKMIPYSSDSYSRIERRWKGGAAWFGKKKYSIHFRLHPTLNGRTLRETVESVLENKQIRMKTKDLKLEFSEYGGCKKIIELVERVIH